MNQQMRLVQKQLQRLAITPQMQQTLNLLQLPLMELRQLIQAELLQNPVLEEVEKEEPPAAETEEERTRLDRRAPVR